MQTFKFDLGIETRVVVPEQVLQAAREFAQDDDASPAFKALDAKFPNDDDQFMQHVLVTELRGAVKAFIVNLIEQRGCGGSVAPARVALIPFDVARDEDLAKTENALNNLASKAVAQSQPTHRKAAALLVARTPQ